MSSAHDLGTAFGELFEQRGQGAADLPAWFRDSRRAAFEHFDARGFPDPRAEEWRYTNVQPIRRQRYAMGGSTSVDPAALEAVRLGASGQLEMVFVNGRFQPQLSHMARVPAGLRLSRLADLLRQEPGTLEGRLGAGLSFDDRGFVALNAAFCEDGAVLMVAPEAVIDRPVHLVFLSTAEPQPVVSYPRILVLAERNSSLTLIEHYAGVGDHRNFCNPVVEIETDAGARLTHYKLQQDSPGAFHIGSIHVRQRRDSVYRSHHVSLGSRLARTDINVHLQEPGAEVHLDGLFMGTGRQHLDTHTRVYHEAPHTRSYESYKGILDKHARGVFKGRVLVQRDAQKIEAHQSSANLLLSDQAEVDTKPELEIYADDVVCSHGATVGQLDRQGLFYLLSRGIDRKWAEGLLTFAFAEEVVSRMDLAAVRERLETIIVGRLPDSEKLRELV